jgi:molybdopterin molybdotransferase
MTSENSLLQRITSLTSIATIISAFDSFIEPVVSRTIAAHAAGLKTLAADVIASADVPLCATALHDGWAINSELTLDAGPYAPVLLSVSPKWVDAGETMPANTDAVLPPDAGARSDSGFEIFEPVNAGEGVLPQRKHAGKGDILLQAGEQVTVLGAAALEAVGITNVSIRAPRVKIIAASVASDDLDFASPVIAKAVLASGGDPEIVRKTSLDALLDKPDADAVIVVGGTGQGRNDTTVSTLARNGALDFYGFAIMPGHTAAFGRVGKCPVLALPGTLDAALSVFLVVGSRLLGRLTGSQADKKGVSVKLTKKITSTIGMGEVIYIRRVEDGVEPIGKSMFPMQKLMQAEGWILIPADSEGIAAGAIVEMRKLP